MRNIFVLTVTTLVFCGCQSVMSLRSDYAPFPKQALQEAAMEIEQAVQRGEREPKAVEHGGVVLTQPDLLQAVRSRAARVELINKLLATGFAWERANGLVEIRSNSDYKRQTTRQQRDTNALTVMNENADRWALYESLIKASNWAPKNLDAVQSIFHDARVKAMPEGVAYEDSTGESVQK